MRVHTLYPGKTEARLFRLKPRRRPQNSREVTVVRTKGRAIRCLLAFGIVLAASGCGDEAQVDEVPPARAPEPPPLVAPWESPELMTVVDAQLLRDPGPLRAGLDSDRPEVRARAALALGSVQDGDAVADLQRRLHDPDPLVRSMAAFALGQVSLPDGGRGLMAALESETDPAVRLRILEALGKRAARGQADALVTWEASDEEEEAARILALSRMGVAGVYAPGLVDEVLAALEHPSGPVRKAGAYLMGRSTTPEGWAGERDRVRQALDALDRSDPAAIQLLLGIGQLRDWADVPRLLGWLGHGRDWRIRVAAARALGNPTHLEAEGVRSALFHAVSRDPSSHVAVAAAQALAEGISLPDPVRSQVEEELRRGPVERWRAHLPLVSFWLGEAGVPVVLEWARRVTDGDEHAGVRAVGLLGSVPGPEATAFLFEALDHPGERVRARALSELGERWQIVALEEGTMRRILQALLAGLESGSSVEAIQAADALSSSVYSGMGAGEAILEASVARLGDEGPDRPAVVTAVTELLAALGLSRGLEALQAMEEDEDPRVRAAVGFAVERLTGERPAGTNPPGPDSTVDWAALEALGDSPRLRLRTDTGEVVIRLLPSQAPLTVQTLVGLAESGRFAGVPFHRVIPGFVAQGGDPVRGDGSGFPGFSIRSEFTTVPFQRGVVGMASSGKDTEGSQFFLTHGRHPHLDGTYTALGWVEEGLEVMDGIVEGHFIREASVLPDLRGEGHEPTEAEDGAGAK
ncbi:MAG: hypothetical protein EA422_03450 [Gemmatimonadales bacterium]|nr:MAG: hypothetical protein EA422_03450 [Gemmatimonadales bacterium]